MPTLAGSYNVNSAGRDTTTLTTPSFTPATGEILVLKGVTETSGFALGTPTASGGGVTWTKRVENATGSNVYGVIWTGTVTSGGSAITVSIPGNASISGHSMTVERWSNAQLATTPVTVNVSGTGAPSTTITTTGVNSVVSYLDGDWAAVAGTANYNNGATQDGIHQQATVYGAYYAYQTAATAGSQSFGMSTPTGQTWTLMAIEIQQPSAQVSLLGQTFNTTSGTHTVVATPAVNDLIVIIRANTGNVTSTTPTDTASGAYTKVTSALKATSADLLEVYVRNSLITSATSTTFSDAAGTTTGGGIAVYKITGMTNTGASAIRGSGVQANQAAATPAPVLSSTPLSSNPIIAALFNATSPATMTPRTGYTETVDVGYATPTTGFESMYRNNGETSATITWGNASASAFCSVALELAYNTLPNAPTQSSPADTATVNTATPQMQWSDTDPNNDAISYEVQVDTVNTFNSVGGTSPLLDKLSASDSGFADITNSARSDPFTSGDTVGYTVQTNVAPGLSYIAGGGAEGTSMTVPGSGSYAAGDLLLMFAFTNGSTTSATLPSGWSSVGINTGTTCASVVAYKVATSGSETSGTWTGATELAMQIYRGQATATAPVINSGAQTGTSTTINYSGIATMTGAGTSWVARFVGTSATNNSIQTAPTGYTNREHVGGSTSDAAGHDSNGVVSSCSFQSVSAGGTAGNYITKTLEILAKPSGADDSLSNGTYYWRVRGKDPTGTNTFGSWSSTRSFVVSNGSVLTATQSAVARITATVTKTQPATARLQNSVTKTQTAVARVNRTLAATQPAVSRINKTLTSTQPATARLTKNLTKTQSAVARLAISGSKTQPAVARISKVIAATQPATARLTNSVTKTQPATARLSKALTKTQAATARLSVTASKTQPAVSRISVTRTKTQAATARLQATATKTQSATARIAQSGLLIADFDDNTAQGFSNVTVTAGGAAGTSYYGATTNAANNSIEPAKTMTTGFVTGYASLQFYVLLPAANVILSGDASAVIIEDSGGWKWTSMYSFIDPSLTTWQQVTIPLSKLTANGDSTAATAGTGAALDASTATTVHFRFWNTSSYTWGLDQLYLTGSAGSTLTATQAATARIQASVSKTQTATSRIQISSSKPQTGTARIQASTTKTQPATARIQIGGSRTQPATARVQITGSKTQPATARLQVSRTKTQPATGRIQRNFTSTQPATSRISQSFTKTQPATARLQVTGTKTQSATARIASGTIIGSATQTATARLQKTVSLTQSATARVAKGFTKTQPAISRIQANPTKTQPATSRIIATASKTQTATGRVAKGFTKTQPASSRISIVGVKTQPATARLRNTISRSQTATARIVEQYHPTTYATVIAPADVTVTIRQQGDAITIIQPADVKVTTSIPPVTSVTIAQPASDVPLIAASDQVITVST